MARVSSIAVRVSSIVVLGGVDGEQLRDALVPDVDDLVVHGERVLDLCTGAGEAR